ncbi:TetR/AcrR family transcriptional regulator [Sphingomonas alpina]|uniref:TetR/AcrR family transcriptional regulator n=1 Tax=Sphingomonas alpina TaxID=653931 RepID=A0A7H0LKZ8_9SPHN|nr:TetR/AcrR family transcriptional regulator [Sphingomonas alpina]QNQ10351.1 TetR/AcrR family transcriptional regulator [Sphingomonas alpina]
MKHRPRTEMIAETRAKLIAAGRAAFGTVGYAEASMDDFTAECGLTRGALYHHFGDKKGLLAAVIKQIDEEMSQRLDQLSTEAPTRWQGFIDENIGYLKMALEPEIQRIVLRDGPAVLGDPSSWPTAQGCVAAISSSIRKLQAEGVVAEMDAEGAARLITGASTFAAQWIANSDDPEATLEKSVAAFRKMLEGLLA